MRVPSARGAARTAFGLALFAVLALPGVARAQILKVGYVDSVRIFAGPTP